MTQSANIVEFLKYASPRLDYIEHCMEKQALSPARALQAVKAFRARTSKGLINPAKYKRLGALSESVGKLKGREKNQLKNVAGKLHNKYHGGNYVKGDYNRVRQRAATPSFEEMYFNQYGRMPDQSMISSSLVSPAAKPKAPSMEEMYFNQYGRMPDQFDAPVAPPKTKTPATGGATAAPKADTAAPKADTAAPKSDTAAPKADTASAGAADAPGAETGMWDTITSWAKEHPYLTAGGGLAAGAATGAGIGYGVGSSSGAQEGASMAQRYYELRDALDRQRLQRANDSFLSRLGNLFGTGELSGLIG